MHMGTGTSGSLIHECSNSESESSDYLSDL